MKLLILLLLALPAAAVTIAPGQSATVTCATGIPTPPPVIPPPPVTPPAGCTPKAHIPVVMGWTGNYVEQRAASGVVMAFPIPPQKPGSSKVTVRLMQGQQPASPAGGITEFTVSRCPGVIDPASACYRKSEASNFTVAPDAFTAAKYSFTSQATVGGRGCWAPRSEGQWYVNVRWTYANCPLAGGCGYSMQWSEGSY